MDYFEFTITGFHLPEKEVEKTYGSLNTEKEFDTTSGSHNLDPEIVMAQLSELGFESFCETDQGLQGYISENDYQEDEVKIWFEKAGRDHGIRYSVQRIAQRNWNEEWERAYDPVTIAGKCMVRAPFHIPVEGMSYDIVIEPKMSFGTAHHATTSLMIEFLMDQQPERKKLLDMGCGTGVLAILAAKMGAAEVWAVDNDEWACRNTLENIEKNGTSGIHAIQGDIRNVKEHRFDVIVANINRNVLLEQIPFYAGMTTPGGVLMMSGFYQEDAAIIKRVATEHGFRFEREKTGTDNWTGIVFSR